MPSKHEMLKIIYEKIADKTLDFGCKIINHGLRGKLHEGYYITNTTKNYRYHYVKTSIYETTNSVHIYSPAIGLGSIEIIGHPVIINRVEWYLSKNDYKFVRQSLSIDELLLPIDNRNEESVKTLFNLCK